MSAKLWTEEQFNCPVCLDLPNDPVTLPCGHSYCMGCIKDYWSKDEAKGIFSCPQCRQTFCPKPPLSRNTMLAEAVEQLRQNALQPAQRQRRGSRKPPSSAVPCDMCSGGERRAAVKSCLVCMSSYCQAHLKPHQSKKSLKEHELIAPTADLADKICTQHKYLQEFFCRQCQMFICWLCTSNQHKDHQCVSTKAERLEKQKVMSEQQVENQQKLKDKEQELKDMKKMMEGMKRSADRVQADGEEELLELRRSVERLQELLEELLDQAEREKLGRAQEVVDALEAELQELRRRDAEMKELARCEDHIHYLQTCESLSCPLEAGDLPPVQVNPEASLDPVLDAVLDLRERVEDLCNQELGRITKQVNELSLFTLGDANRGSGAKAGILKLFSSLGSRGNSSRPAGTGSAASPGGSAGSRSADRRGLGLKSQDVRSRDTPRDRRNTNSPRMRDRQRGEERATVPAPRPAPSPAPALSPAPSPAPAPAPRASQSLWSRSSQNPVVPAAPAVAPSGASSSSSGFSRMASISSIFRSHRRGNTPATPINNHTQAGAGDTRSMSSLPETPTEVNPALFLDSPTHTPAFPALREINIDSIQAPEPRSREEFLQYCVTLTLDPDTAHRQLLLSEGNTKATLQAAPQHCADGPQRFDGWTQVLSRSPLLAQRCYWEVEWRGRGSSVGVAYGSLGRKGSDARAGLGYNAQSWGLELSDTCCSAMHDNQKVDIAVSYSPRLAVFADAAAGTLAFYAVAGSMTHLHTFRANFTQPLYAAFGVGSGVGVGLDFALGRFSSSSDSVKICPM